MAAHVVGRRNAHAGAGARTAFEQPFELEPQQRLRHGEKAHAELGRDLPPGHGLPERELAAQDAAPDDIVRLGREAGHRGFVSIHGVGDLHTKFAASSMLPLPL